MLFRCAVLLLYINVGRTFELDAGLSKNFVRDIDTKYSLWPSIHNGVRLMRIYKREADAPPSTTSKPDAQPGAQGSAQTVVQEGEASIQSGAQANAQSNAQSGPQSSAQSALITAQTSAQASAQSPLLSPPQSTEQQQQQQQQPQQQKPAPPVSTQAPAPTSNTKDKDTEKPLDNNTVHKTLNGTASVNATVTIDKTKAHNTTETEPPSINLSDPGVLKRAFIVFGGFALLAAAYYFIIYRKKGNTNNDKNAHSSIDQNQFRYGVLESEDKRSNMELSRVPLTMESDEDEDEDLEIFDLGQKKKSLSYINLEQHDEDIVLNDSRSIDMENILVDIDDKNTDMINWSGNGSKSIL